MQTIRHKMKVIKYKDEIRNIHSDHDIGNFQPEKTKKQRNHLKQKNEKSNQEGEQLNMILDEGNNTPS